MPRTGLFARVLEGGALHPDAVKMLRGETAHPEQDKERLISINSAGEQIERN
jgi:hypothetical protein